MTKTARAGAEPSPPAAEGPRWSMGFGVPPLIAATLLGASMCAQARPVPSTVVDPSTEPLRTAVVSTLEKVRPGTRFVASSEAQLTAGRGACQAAQVVVLPPASHVTAEISALRDTSGNEVPVELYRQAYVPVTTPSNSEGAVGLWPDPLIPVRDRFHGEPRNALPAESSAAEPLVLYAEACVPPETPPGMYWGSLRLEAEGVREAAVPFRLEVQPFVLPATATRPTTAGLDLWSLVKGHGMDGSTAEARALLKDYATALLAHRVSAYWLTGEPPRLVRWNGNTPVLDFKEYDAQLAPFLDAAVLPSQARFSAVQIYALQGDGITSEQRTSYYRALAAHHREKGWTAQPFVLTVDEPRPEDYARVIAQADAVRAAGVFPVLITTPPANATLRGLADILASPINCFFPRDSEPSCANPMPLPLVRAVLPNTTRVWWYQTCLSHGCGGGPLAKPELEAAFVGWPSVMVDHSVASNRAMGPLGFRDRIDGELYYNTVQAYTQAGKDPWKDLFVFGGNGDGTLFYPGTPEHIGGKTHVPVESRRLKELREGNQLYEELRLLAEGGDALYAQALAERLVGVGEKVQISQDPAEWEAVQRELGQRLSAQWLASGARRKGLAR